jgi:hypothetical protein
VNKKGLDLMKVKESKEKVSSGFAQEPSLLLFLGLT